MKNTSSLSLLYNLFILLATLFIDPTHAHIVSTSAPETPLRPGQNFNITVYASPDTQFSPVVFTLAPYKQPSEWSLPVNVVGKPPNGLNYYTISSPSEGYNVTLQLDLVPANVYKLSGEVWQVSTKICFIHVSIIHPFGPMGEFL